MSGVSLPSNCQSSSVICGANGFRSCNVVKAASRTAFVLFGTHGFFQGGRFFLERGREVGIVNPTHERVLHGTTLTLDIGIFKSSAVCWRQVNEACVAVQIFRRPSSFQFATATCGSMYP